MASITADNLFARAKEGSPLEDVAQRLGCELRRSGHEMRSGCPLCGTGGRGTIFQVKLGKGTFRCFACNAYGDVIDLYAKAQNLSLVDAAKALTCDHTTTSERALRQAKPHSNEAAGKAERQRIYRETLWAESTPIAGTPAETYLLGRAIDSDLICRAAGLRFHPCVRHSWVHAERTWLSAPAMICRPVAEGEPTGGLHVTYLSRDGREKVTLDPRRRMLGPQGRRALNGARLRGGVMIIPQPADRGLVVAEGIETALALAGVLSRRGKGALGVCAALSLDGLQGGIQYDNDGCMDVWRPTGDLASPPFLLDPCNATAEFRPSVFIGIDRDMKPVRVRGRSRHGRIVQFDIDGYGRAEICAALSLYAWRRIGWDAKAMFPRYGYDWNDQLKDELSKS